MNLKEKNINFNFKIIELLSCNIHTPDESVIDLDIDILNYNVTSELKLNIETNTLWIIVQVIISNKDGLVELGNIRTSSIFEVDNLNDLISNTNNDQAPIPDHFATVLNSISLSTTRGIMWGMFRGTILHNAVLPVLDPNYQ